MGWFSTTSFGGDAVQMGSVESFFTLLLPSLHLALSLTAWRACSFFLSPMCAEFHTQTVQTHTYTLTNPNTQHDLDPLCNIWDIHAYIQISNLTMRSLNSVPSNAEKSALKSSIFQVTRKDSTLLKIIIPLAPPKKIPVKNPIAVHSIVFVRQIKLEPYQTMNAQYEMDCANILYTCFM